MSNSLRNFGKSGYRFDSESLKVIAKDEKGQPFQIPKDVLEFEGNTVFERCHPTFISKKRKVILTCPRKVGHSSIRFYLNYMNQEEGDDWTWIEDNDRDPREFLDENEYLEFIDDLLSDDNRINLKSTEDVESLKKQETINHPVDFKAELVYNKDKESIDKLFGAPNDITWSQAFVGRATEHRYFPPFQLIKPLKDYTSYLVVRDPWDRFISGLITEMDNGLMNPWKYDKNAKTEEGWEKLYNASKRVLYFTEPEYLTIGGLDGPQANHTFILSRPLYKGKSMYDIYDKLIHYKHEIEFVNNNGNLEVDTSKVKDIGVLDKLLELGFISQAAVTKFHEGESHNMFQHTHVNITPHIRQHVIDELQKDEDMKEWWDRCREIVDLEYSHLKNNQHKF